MNHYHAKVYRKDALQDHEHALPNGKMTGGSLYKPMINARAGLHTHLYEMDGHVLETSPEYEGGDHTHVSEYGDTSGPKKLDTGPGAAMPREDSEQRSDYIQRRGRDWFVVSETGAPLGKHPDKGSAERQLRAIEANKAS